MRRKPIVLLLPLSIAAICLLLSFSNDKRKFQLSQQLNIFNSIIKELDLFYVDTIMPEKMIGRGIDAMLSRCMP